ncbi:hypothetical protein HWV03_16610 [Moritella sp. 36]|uniref:IucA/IucC family protein n=1 Tax=Moritella sp. 36 TaxID=2746233 RepID=UPI001BA57AEE|nr:IucA/IucC family protein [Moritella sp. 36]QUM90303.1 hypothetical protein HWV03_16610 [Moritella sp. 36]
MIQSYDQILHQNLAKIYSLRGFLNCFCREVAGPQGALSYPEDIINLPDSIFQSLQETGGILLNIDLHDGQLICVVDKKSQSYQYRYLSYFLFQNNTQDQQELDWDELQVILLNDLASRFNTDANDELLAQMNNSEQVLAYLLLNRKRSKESTNLYLESESKLLLGHATHPAAKSRLGFSQQDILDYSPELRASFQLHYFAAKSDKVKRLGTGLSDDTLRDFSATYDSLPPDYALLPVHPWQAKYLLKQDVIIKLIEQGLLIDLGVRGKKLTATSSLRTLYNPELDFFIKGSLNVRITNCVRKNAYYELESAVKLTELLTPNFNQLEKKYPGLKIMHEPGCLTLDFDELDAEKRVQIEEGFGVLFRENPTELREQNILLAGSLFTQGVSGESNVKTHIWHLSQRNQMSYEQSSLLWFRSYLDALLPSMFDALFEHGLVFEPHLQNILIKLEQDLVAGVWIRDLEGTKLNKQTWQAQQLSSMSEKASSSVLYDQEKCWNRLAYCLLINNIVQAIFCIARRESVLEARLWHQVRLTIQQYLAQSDSEFAANKLGDLLAGKAIPNKANLITRFLKRADKQAEYTDFPNPLGFPRVIPTKVKEKV